MLDTQSFIVAMRSVPTPVSIVTTNGSLGAYGATVSAVCSLSAEPPSVLICLNRQSRILGLIEEHGAFCVNFIADQHKDLALAFAGAPSDKSRRTFETDDWKINTGQHLPVLQGAVAYFQCLHTQTVSFGSHRILIGKVDEAVSSSSEPLTYRDGKFIRLQPVE